MNVSRETQARLDRFLALLVEWQRRMNLVAPSTLSTPEHAWSRHFEDSLQLLDLVEAPPRIWVDLGSGAGFPGLVVAAAAEVDMHLVESVAKKCAFLREVARELGIAERVTVHNARAESMAGPKADVISARACAALPKLFDWGRGFAARSTLWLLPKGRTVDAEIAAAKRLFEFDHRLHPSRTDPDARIVAARHVRARGLVEAGNGDEHAGSCDREPEGRRRQDDDDGQPRHRARGRRPARAARRSRPAR